MPAGTGSPANDLTGGFLMGNNRHDYDKYSGASAKSGPAAVLVSNESLTRKKFNPYMLLCLLIPAVLAILLSFLLEDNHMQFLLWWSVLFVFGIGAFPVTSLLFSSFRGKGYGFAKAFGILSVSFVLWTLCYLNALRFTRFWIAVFLFVFIAVTWGIPKTRQAAVQALSTPEDVWHIALEECLFVLALAAWCFIKGLRPEIDGEEKFMDFAFLNSLVRTNTLPAPDPWLAGSSINYYYYGQYIYALITKLTGITTGVAYNLSMCTTFALAFTMSYSLGSMFMDGARKSGLGAPGYIRIPAGLLSGFAVTLFGNSHAFFYADSSKIGQSILSFFSWAGINVGRTNNFYYPDSTRFIGHNPDSEVWDTVNKVLVKNGDYTIHEFPCYSYLLGDLHAHVVGLMIVMLIIAVLFSLYMHAGHPEGSEMLIQPVPHGENCMPLKDRAVFECRHLLKPEIIITAVLLGIATMCNYWDFLIYFIVGCMVLLIYNIKTSRHLSSIPGLFFFFIETAMILSVYLKFSSAAVYHVVAQLLVLGICLIGTILLPCAMTRTGLGMSFLFSVAALCSLTFNSRFDMIANSLAKTVSQSSPYQFLILWGVHLAFAILLIILTIRSKMPPPVLNRSEKPYIPNNPVSRFLADRNAADIFMSGIAAVSFMLLAAPEIFYVRDIYGGSYKRANTMFKFTFEAFVLLSLVMAYTVFRFISRRRKKNSHTFSIAVEALVICLLISIPAYYPTVAIEQRSGEISVNNYKGLDGTAAIARKDSSQLTGGAGDLASYAAAIRWLNENVSGTPNICEAYGFSYTDNCLVSAYTGLPTIIGWQTHEWLWRFQGIVVNGELVNNPDKPNVWTDILTPRQTAVKSIYTGGYTMAKTLLTQYNVTYLIVGDLERTQYGTIDDTVLKSLGTTVFESGTLYIVQVQ